MNFGLCLKGSRAKLPGLSHPRRRLTHCSIEDGRSNYIVYISTIWSSLVESSLVTQTPAYSSASQYNLADGQRQPLRLRARMRPLYKLYNLLLKTRLMLLLHRFIFMLNKVLKVK